MFYQVSSRVRRAGDREGPVWTLAQDRSGASAEIWPDHGFNCLRWQVGGLDEPLDCLFSMPDWEQNPVPTRSGIPILFPFPNRVRGGEFRFRGKTWHLPKIDSTKTNAIHGYAPRKAWRVVDSGADNSSAFLTGEFQASKDAPETLDTWPADYILRITYRLTQTRLRMEATVVNPTQELLPFGLGLHPYFRHPMAGIFEDISQYKIHAPATAIWELEDSLPTGERKPLPPALDFNKPKVLGDLQMDTVFTGLPRTEPNGEVLLTRCRIEHMNYTGALRISSTADFREMLLFTPAHRKAFCVEPYTCATDAVNLNDRGIDAGWRVIAPGETWSGAVEYAWDSDSTGIWSNARNR